MPRRSKPKVQKRDWRWYASFGLNAAVALSMVLGTVFLFTGGSIVQRSAAVPTLDISTAAPNGNVAPTLGATPAEQPTNAPAAPNPAPPSPTPKASAQLLLPLFPAS